MIKNTGWLILFLSFTVFLSGIVETSFSAEKEKAENEKADREKA
jgi:hypothetical protein